MTSTRVIALLNSCSWSLTFLETKRLSGGTNVTHATNPPPKEIDPRPVISVDMRRMKWIFWINKEDGLAHIEAGIVGRDLVDLLGAEGFTMGHEPDSLEFSTLGGWIATRASGMSKFIVGAIVIECYLDCRQ